MREVTIAELRRNLFAVVLEASRGAEVLVTNRGMPVARVGPISHYNVGTQPTAVEPAPSPSSEADRSDQERLLDEPAPKPVRRRRPNFDPADPDTDFEDKLPTYELPHEQHEAQPATVQPTAPRM